jgi:hypothetical protein
MIDSPLTDALKPAVDTLVEQRDAGAVDDSPKFGRLLIVLVVAVLLMGLLTVVSEAFYS